MANENLDIDSKTAEELYEWYLDDKLIINRRYQRKLVWSLEEKTALISCKRKLTAVCSHQTRIGNLDAHLI